MCVVAIYCVERGNIYIYTCISTSCKLHNKAASGVSDTEMSGTYGIPIANFGGIYVILTVMGQNSESINKQRIINR